MPVITGPWSERRSGRASAAVGLAISAALLEVIRKPLWPYMARVLTVRQVAGPRAHAYCCAFIGSALSID